MTTACRAVSRLRHKPSLTNLSESGRINGYVRTENDTWDIKTSVGSTALFVAAARALEAHKLDPLVRRPVRRGVLPGSRRRMGRRARRQGAASTQLMTEFGSYFVNFQAARTRYFDDYFEAAAAVGVRQIVILAAGLGLARLPAGVAGRDGGLRAGSAAGAGVQTRGAGRAR